MIYLLCYKSKNMFIYKYIRCSHIQVEGVHIYMHHYIKTWDLQVVGCLMFTISNSSEMMPRSNETGIVELYSNCNLMSAGSAGICNTR